MDSVTSEEKEKVAVVVEAELGWFDWIGLIGDEHEDPANLALAIKVLRGCRGKTR